MFNLRKILGKEDKTVITLASPMEGEVIPLSKVSDPTFAEEMLGTGVAILPEGGRIVSPVNGTVVQVFDTGHAVTLLSDEGVEVLIHIGLDTVKLQGEPFTKIAKDGQSVRVGDVLVEFDQSAIIAAGYETVTPVVICNSGDYQQFERASDQLVKEGDKLISFTLKEER